MEGQYCRLFFACQRGGGIADIAGKKGPPALALVWQTVLRTRGAVGFIFLNAKYQDDSNYLMLSSFLRFNRRGRSRSPIHNWTGTVR
jgi:hypothetical protein